jgi:predicted permease
MENFQHLHETLTWLLPVIIILAIWEGIWKLIALWKSARNNHLAWFICIAIFNTIGILPIIYILKNKKKEEGI